MANSNICWAIKWFKGMHIKWKYANVEVYTSYDSRLDIVYVTHVGKNKAFNHILNAEILYRFMQIELNAHTHTLHTNGGRMFRPLQLFSHSKYIFDMEEQSNRWDYCAKHKLVRNNAHLRERGFKSIWKRARANIRHTKWTTVFWILRRISQNCKYIFYSVYTSSAESKSRFSWSTSWMSVFVLLFFLS